jgi:exonuclease III
MSLTILTLNANGLRNNSKRHKLFCWCRDKGDIIFLQETHCTNADMCKWTSEWGGEAIWTDGSSMSKGVAILFKQGLNVQFSNVMKKDERMISLTLSVENQKTYQLVNVYAPNAGTERKQFITNLTPVLNTDESDVILGGDLNCAMNGSLDRQNCMTKVDEGVKEIKLMQTKHNLEDVWRRRNPTKRAFTYRHGDKASRIDYILISKSLDSDVKVTKIQHCPYSDHDAVNVKIKTDDVERGPGIWKMNTTVINTPDFENALHTLWKIWCKEIHTYTSKKCWWELTKVKIKQLCYSIAKQQHTSNAKLAQLECKIQNIRLKGANCTEEETCKLNTLIKQVQAAYDKKAEAAKVRSRVDWYENGEKSTKYFQNLESRNGKKKLWHSIKCANGTTKYDIDSILHEQVQFYSQLFKSESWDESAADELLSNLTSKLSDNQKAECNRHIGESNIENAIKQLKSNKSPGSDGITAEFYKLYWPLIKNELTAVIKEIFAENELSRSQYKGIVALQYKQGDRQDIKNWRPITLLNVDYKIIAKIIANKVQPILPTIIHSDQKGFIKGRNITEAIRLIQDVIEYTEQEDIEGSIIFLDQQKAFDRVEWGWIDKCMSKFEFPAPFREWIVMLYKNAENHILTNGHLSRSFPISRSVRQGCPIAPLLYVIQAEPMAASIRCNDRIQGIKLPSKQADTQIEVKINMFADDTQLFNGTEESISETFKTLDTYEKASGAKINTNKTKGMFIGRWKNKTSNNHRISWTKHPIKALGVLHGYGIDEKQTWKSKIDKMQSCLQVWKTRDLTYEGKVTVLKTYILPIIAYEIDVRGIPDEVLKEVNTIIWAFLWDNKPPLLKKEVVRLDKKRGGLGMFDLNNIVKSKQIKLLYKIINSDTQTWNAIGKFWLQSLDTKYADTYFLCKCSNMAAINELNANKIKISPFYKGCLESWIQFRKLTITPTTPEEVLCQQIFGNAAITHKNKTLLYSHWSTSGIQTIQDIWSMEHKAWIPPTELLNKLKVKRNWIAEYTSIKHAIPTAWYNIMQKSQVQSRESHIIFRGKNLQLFNTHTLKILDEKAAGQKLLGELLSIKTDTKSKGEIKWEHHFQEEINWDMIWKYKYEGICAPKAKQLHWKILHKIINTEMRLKQMRLSTGKCTFCKHHEENELHLFSACTFAKTVWNQVWAKYENTLNERDINKTKPDNKEIILGSTNSDKTVRERQNLYIFTTKWHIWKAKTNTKYGAKRINAHHTAQAALDEILFISKLTDPITK